MSLPAFRDGSDLPDPFAPTATATIPFCQAGDLLLAFSRFDSQALSGAPAAPAGWTMLRYADGAPDQVAAAVATVAFIRQATDTDAGTVVDFAVGGGIPASSPVGIIAFSNAYGAEQAASNASFGSGTGTTDQRAAAVTTVRANQLIVEIFGWIQHDVGASDAATPSTERFFWSNSAASDTLGLVVSTQPQTVPGTTTGRQVTTTSAAQGTAITLSIYPNDPPNAPTLIAPADGSTVNVDAGQRFFWVFSDPDPADLQTAFEIQTSDDAGASWAALAFGGTLTFFDAPAGLFAAGVDYQWRVRTTDRYGAVGPWSSAFNFTGASTPDVPAITAPVSDEIITDSSVDVSWTFGSQQAYQVRLVADDGTGSPDTATVLYDTGQIDDVVTHTVTVPLDTTGVTVHAQVSAKAAGIWSAFADVRFTVDFNAPPAPTLTLTTNDQAAAITVYLTNPAPTGDQLDTLYNDLLISADGAETWARYATLLPPNAQWTFRTPASGVDYQFRAVAYTAAGTFAYSDWVDEATVDMGAPAVAPDLIPEGSP